MLPSSILALRELLSHRLPDEFSRIVLDGSMRVAWDAANPIRANLFAAGIRELITYILHHLAPDELVKACGWYISHRAREMNLAEKNNKEFKDQPTRMHRMMYATQGGLPDDALEGMGVDIKDDHKRLRSVVDELSKYTHVRPGSLVEGDAEVNAFMDEALRAVIRFLDTFREGRDAIEEAVAERINDAADAALTETSIDELDELSTHTYVEEVVADDVRVTAIGPDEVQFSVRGTVYVELNYGSSSDFNRGDGATMSGKYPFSVRMAASIHDMKPYILGRIAVDNSSFYE